MCRFARNAENYDLVMTAVRHYWNASLPLVSQPIERELLREPIKVMLQCITATAEKVKKTEVHITLSWYLNTPWGNLNVKLIRIEEMKICMFVWYFYGLNSKWLFRIYSLFSTISSKIWYGIFLLFNKLKSHCAVFMCTMCVKVGKSLIEVPFF